MLPQLPAVSCKASNPSMLLYNTTGVNNGSVAPPPDSLIPQVVRHALQLRATTCRCPRPLDNSTSADRDTSVELSW